MGQSSLIRSALMTVVAFGAVLGVYELVRSPRDLSAGRNEPAQPQPSQDVPDAVSALPAPDPGPLEGVAYTLANDLMGMPAGARNAILGLTIRDAGFACREVVNAHDGARAAWRVACPDAQAYFVTVDALGRLVVEPLSFSEGPPITFGDPDVPGSRRTFPVPVEPAPRQ